MVVVVVHVAETDDSDCITVVEEIVDTDLNTVELVVHVDNN